LEYAEEHGLSTGVLTNVNIADATPAACYSHVNDRGKFGEIFGQLFSPRFGDGADVVMGTGRTEIWANARAAGKDLDAVATRPVYASLAGVPASEPRPIVVTDGNLDLRVAALTAIGRLSANPKGYFLMIEWDAHTDDPARGLTNLVNFDRLIREIASEVDLGETLLLFTADHSFDLRMHGGQLKDPVLSGWREAAQQHKPGESIHLPVLRIDDSHTGEEVLATAQGPGAELVHGFFPNTHLFDVMMNAYGWTK
jgi:alkaline phosphatase